MRRTALALLLGTAALGIPTPSPAAAAPRRSVVLAFMPAGERDLAAAGLSVGILSATQGHYQATQMLLDITQGARIASSAYPNAAPPRLGVAQGSSAGADAGTTVGGWPEAVARAKRAPQLLTPGLLGARVPGGAGYVAARGGVSIDQIAAADQHGAITSTSLGSTATLPARVASMASARGLVVADLAAGEPGRSALARLVRERASGELLLVVQRVSEESPTGQLLWSAAAGLPGGERRELTSATTKDRGLISAVDLAPTILGWLEVPVPAEMRGRTIEAPARLSTGSLRSLMSRLRVVGERRLRALGILLAAWVALLLMSAPWPTARARALRVGGLGLLWAPVAVMATAALEPGAAAEYAAITCICLGLGALSDVLLSWPRAILAPAVTAALAITIDALGHHELLTRSLMGPNPILGARFYGIGNELKSALAVLVLGAVAGQWTGSGRGRQAVLATVGAGATLAAIEGSARIGAGVGGVILVCAGFAVTAVMLAPGALTRRRALIVLIAPLAGLIALAAIDLATAHGSGHFTGSILHARSAGDVRDILVRRYKAAWGELRNHAMPVATALCMLAAAAAVRSRERLLAPLDGDPVWVAALCGGLASGVVGALVEDSGPVLLVVAVFTLGCVLSYLWGRPPALPARTGGTPLATRSRARRPPAARARSSS